MVLRDIRRTEFAGTGGPGYYRCFSGSSDLFLNLSAKLQGRRDAIKRLERSAGSADHDRAIAEDSSGDTLIHANTLNLVQKHLRRFFLNKSGLENDSLVRYRELR